MQVNSVVTKELQGVTEQDSSKTENAADDFTSYLTGLLTPDAANNVSEEELFAGLISERLKTDKSQELSDKYNSLLESKKTEMTRAGGYVPCEDAAKASLREMRDSGDLTAEEADQIYSEAFAGAQLDGNSEALYDGQGGPGDDTIAINTLEQALLSARTITEKFDKGEESVTTRSLDEASNSKPAVGAALPASNEQLGSDGSGEQFVNSDAGGDSNSQNTESSGSDNNISNNAPALELALGLNKQSLSQRLSQSLFKALTPKKDKEL